MECVDWESEAAQAAMLRNLKRKHIDFDKVIAPAQIEENCWFNCYFMCFFISLSNETRYLRCVDRSVDKRKWNWLGVW